MMLARSTLSFFSALLVAGAAAAAVDCFLDWNVNATAAFAGEFVDALQAATVVKQLQRHEVTAEHLLLFSADDGEGVTSHDSDRANRFLFFVCS